MTDLKVTRKIQVDDVWLHRGTQAWIIAIHTCRETGVSHVQTKDSMTGTIWRNGGYTEVSTFLRGCQMRLGKFVRTERKFLGIRLPPRVDFVKES